MKLYLVVRVGVYDQGVFGCYTHLSSAERAVEYCFDHEKDGYHDFEIRDVELDSEPSIARTRKRYSARPGGEGSAFPRIKKRPPPSIVWEPILSVK
jgi:hypothetical protein